MSLKDLKRVTDVTLVARMLYGKDEDMIDAVAIALGIPDVNVVIVKRETKFSSKHLIEEWEGDG